MIRTLSRKQALRQLGNQGRPPVPPSLAAGLSLAAGSATMAMTSFLGGHLRVLNKVEVEVRTNTA